MNIYTVTYQKYDGANPDSTTVVARTLERATERVKPFLRKQTGYPRPVLVGVVFTSRVGCVDR